MNNQSEKRLAYQIYNDTNNNLIANIYIENNVYTADLVSTEKPLPILFGFPEMGSRPNPKSEYIENFLADRVIPSNRQNIKQLLEMNGLSEYDWRELIKLNKGRTTDDCYRVETVE